MALDELFDSLLPVGALLSRQVNWSFVTG